MATNSIRWARAATKRICRWFGRSTINRMESPKHHCRWTRQCHRRRWRNVPHNFRKTIHHIRACRINFFAVRWSANSKINRRIACQRQRTKIMTKLPRIMMKPHRMHPSAASTIHPNTLARAKRRRWQITRKYWPNPVTIFATTRS